MEKDKIKKIILALILLVGLIAIGLFFVGQKLALNNLAKEKELAAQTENDKMDKPVKILFVGDMMFDRYIRQTAERKGSDFVFAGVAKMLSENDLVIGNLEGPITDKPSVSVGSEIGARDNYIFTFNPGVASELWKNNIKLVSLGNNHIFNFGADGLVQTKENLQNNKVAFFGDPAGEKRIATWNQNGLKLAFVVYNQFEKDGVAKTLADIKAAKKMNADEVILYAHWGTEFVGQSDAKIKELAHGFIDGGVDLVIGSHPHVVQGKEQYQGKMIYYSLGNFIFDQYFSHETQQGLAVQLEIDTKKQTTFKELPVTMKTNGQTVLK